MADTEQRFFPVGRIALDNGDLIDAQKFNVTWTNNAKQQHTLRKRGAGFTEGVVETTVSFDVLISQDGLERDYITMAKNKLIKQLRMKFPGSLTIDVEGIFKDLTFDAPLDDATKVTCTFIGNMEVS